MRAPLLLFLLVTLVACGPTTPRQVRGANDYETVITRDGVVVARIDVTKAGGTNIGIIDARTVAVVTCSPARITVDRKAAYVDVAVDIMANEGNHVQKSTLTTTLLYGVEDALAGEAGAYRIFVSTGKATTPP